MVAWDKSAIGALALVCGVLASLFAPPSSAQNACWPNGGAPEAAPTIPPTPTQAAGATVVYFDGSGSMAGYVRPPTKGAEAESLLRTLILLLPQTLLAAGEQGEFYEFGKKQATDKTEFVKLSDKSLQELTKPTYYCPTQLCKYQDSPIADALKRIVEQPLDSLGMVITDLFLSNAELIGIGGRELQIPLSKALREGRAIGVLALKAASTGPVYDLTSLEKNQCYSREKGPMLCPGNEAPHYSGATSRPLFVVMIGPTQRILQFKQKLDSDLLKEVPAGQQRFTIFTKQAQKAYLPPERWSKSTFQSKAKPDVGDFLGPFFQGGFPGQQIVLPSRSTDGLSGEVDLAELWTPGVPPPSTLSLEAKSWFQRGARCDQMWHALPANEMRRFVELERVSDFRVRIKIGSPVEANLVPNFPAYLVAGKITASGSRLEQWFEEWGYNEADEMRVLEKRPAFFPAKNLPRIGKVLLDIIQEKTNGRDVDAVSLGEFRLGIKVR